jgi:hypothetical protein
VEPVDGVEFAIPVEAKCPRQLHVQIPPMYYAQVQVQLACCDAPHGYFVSWVEDSDAQYVEKIERDPVWWAENYPVLEAFYNEFVLPDVEPPNSPRRGKKGGRISDADRMKDHAEMLKEKADGV